MLIMKEQWKLEEKTVTLEEGGPEEQESTTEHESKVNRCKGSMQYLKLVLYVELILFFGWGCYMILQIHRSELIEKEIADIIHERDLPAPGSQPILNSNAEMPMVFSKPEVILEKLNKLLENIKSIHEQHLKQNNAIDVDTQIHTSTQNSIIDITEQSDNIKKEKNVIDWVFPDFMNNEKTTRNLPSQEMDLFDNIREILLGRDKGSSYNSRFFTKLRDTASLKDIDDLKKFTDRLTENTNNSTLNKQKNHTLNTINKTEDSGLDTLKSPNLDNSMTSKINVTFVNDLQNSESEYFDTIEQVTQNQNEKSSFHDNSLNQDLSSQISSQLPAVLKLFPNFPTQQKTTDSSFLDPVRKHVDSIETEKHNNHDVNIVASSANDNTDNSKLMSLFDMLTLESNVPQSSYGESVNKRNINQHSLETTKNAKSNEESMKLKSGNNEFFERWWSDINRGELLTQDGIVIDSNQFNWFVPPAKPANRLLNGPSNGPIKTRKLLQSSMEKLMPDALDTTDYVDCNGDSVGKPEDELLITEKNPDNKVIIPSDLPKITDKFEIAKDVPNHKISNVILSDSPIITETDSSNNAENVQEVINNSNKKEIKSESISASDPKFLVNSDTVTTDNKWHTSSESLDKQQQQGITNKQDSSYKNVTPISEKDKERQILHEVMDSLARRTYAYKYMAEQSKARNRKNYLLNVLNSSPCSNSDKCLEAQRRQSDELTIRTDTQEIPVYSDDLHKSYS